MDILQLKYFLKVAELSHMSQASEELNISQPALSSNIKKLEAELGVELFTRHGRHIELNPYGKFLQKQLSPVLEKLDDVFIELREMRYAEFNEVVIDADPIYTFSGLLDRMTASLKMCGATIRNVRYPVPELLKLLLSNEIDFAVIGMDFNDEHLEKRLLSRDELVMLVHNSHPLAHCFSAPLFSFANEEFAVKERSGVMSSYDFVSERYCKEAGFKPNIAFKSFSRRELVDVVRSRHYVMLTPINAVSQYKLDDLSIIHISDMDCYAPLWMYWKKDVKERSSVKILRETIINFFDERNR